MSEKFPSMYSSLDPVKLLDKLDRAREMLERLRKCVGAEPLTGDKMGVTLGDNWRELPEICTEVDALLGELQ